jgi:hypothetical protein
MAKVKIQGNAAGSGVFTVTSPVSNTNRTITLPDSAGTLLDENSSLPAANLTGTVADARISTLTSSKLSGALPALNAANLTAIPAANITGTLPAISGANLTGIAGRRNMIINGAMKVAQRSTSTVAQADASNEGYATLDRWYLQFASGCPGTVTTSKSTEAPAGFRSSIKLDCTSTGTPVDTTNDYIRLWQKIEGQDLQGLAFGTSSAKSITLSWYMKSTTYTDPISIHFLTYGTPADEYYNVTVTPTTSWVRYSVTVPGSTSLTFADTNAAGLNIGFTIAGPATPQHTQASNSTSWSTTVSNAVTDIGNLVSSTSNVLYITGVQLELGSVVTDFEHRSYGEELALCRRYFQAHAIITHTPYCVDWRGGSNSDNMRGTFHFDVTMRAAPTQGFLGDCHWYEVNNNTNAPQSLFFTPNIMAAYNDQGANILGDSSDDAITFSAEL